MDDEPDAYFYYCDGVDKPVLTHKKQDWAEKYDYWKEVPLYAKPKEKNNG
jgi:hypothetical protein